MKSEYREVRRILSEDLRELCIRKIGTPEGIAKHIATC